MKRTMAIKVLVVCLAVCLLVPFTKSASAAWDGFTAGTVGHIFVGGKGGAYFNLEGSPPLCASAGSHASFKTFGLLYSPPQTDSETDFEGGKAMLALLMSAKLSGKLVTVFALNGKPGPDGTIWGCIVGGIEIH